jgi:hypothetical protein
MQSLEIVVVGQFHEPAKLRFDCVKGRGIQRLSTDGGSSRDGHCRKSRRDEEGKTFLVHVGMLFQV